MSNLLLEVDEAMRWERMEKLWKEYGKFVIAFIVATILATAIASAWKSWSEHSRAKDTEHLTTLLTAENFPENLTPENLKMRASLRGIALVNAGAHDLETGKTETALKFYSQAADDSSIPDDIRHLALLMKARMINADAKSQENPAALLQPVIEDKKSPWQPYALMEAAAIAANRDHDLKTARAHLKQLLETEGLPPSLYNKAKALDLVYTTRLQQTPQTTDQKS
jgi:hypothetical protein